MQSLCFKLFHSTSHQKALIQSEEHLFQFETADRLKTQTCNPTLPFKQVRAVCQSLVCVCVCVGEFVRDRERGKEKVSTCR